MTNITPTIIVLDNSGQEMLIEAKVAGGSLLVSSADTVDCSGASMIQSADNVKIVSVTAEQSGRSLTQYVTWTKSTRKFAFDGGVAGTNIDTTLRAASADEVRIEFRLTK
jgi:hypothetical protein